jgi:hypothetical protein
MKVRNGCVSNSSSSSFVYLGINLNEHTKLKGKFYDEDNKGYKQPKV